MTGRVPIVFPFPPSRHLRYIDDEEHIPPSMPFTRVFDLPRLAHTLRIPIVQIDELKTRIKTKPLYGEAIDPIKPKEEELGGWSTWMITNPEFFPKKGQTLKDVPKSDGRRCYQLDEYRISASSSISCALDGPPPLTSPSEPTFVPVPLTFKPKVDWRSTSLDELATIFQPQPNPFSTYYLREGVPAYFKERDRPVPAPLPEEHVLYVDFLYNLGEGGTDGREDWTGISGLGKHGAWETVGQHMHWEPALEEMARGYIRRMFGVKDKAGKRPPPFIAVHIRRSDIGNVCKDLTPEELEAAEEKDCYSSLTKYVRKVDAVKARLASERGISPKYVVATTDEHDEGFLDQVRELGWHLIDHDGEQTIENHGLWCVWQRSTLRLPSRADQSLLLLDRYPTLLDSVILSLGSGFVGTSGSTSRSALPYRFPCRRADRTPSLVTVSEHSRSASRRGLEPWHRRAGAAAIWRTSCAMRFDSWSRGADPDSSCSSDLAGLVRGQRAQAVMTGRAACGRGGRDRRRRLGQDSGRG